MHVRVGDGMEHPDAVEADAVLNQPGDPPDHGPDLLVPLFARDAKYRGLGDRRMGVERLLDLS